MTISTLQFTDYSNEKSSVTFQSAALAESTFDTDVAAIAALSVATAALSIGLLTRRTYAQVALDDPDTPTNVYAQREIKWLVSYRGDTSGKLYQLEIPAANLTSNLVANTDLADLSSTQWAAWVGAFETTARAPDNLTETVTVISARVVGRNI